MRKSRTERAGRGDGSGLVLALFSALLLLLAQPPFRLLLLPFVALTPLAVALGALPPGKGSGLAGARIGLFFGVFHWGVLLSWVPLVVAPQFPWAYPGYAAQVGLLGGLTALMGWATQKLHGDAGVPLALAFPLAWVSMEWLKAHFPLGLSFPWLGLGISLTSWPSLLGLAEWTGEAGVAFWLALVNGLLASSVLGARKKERSPGPLGRPWPVALLAAGVGFLPGLLGVARARSLPLRRGPTIAVVGTNIPRTLRLRPLESSREGLDQVRDILRGLDPGSPDLVILPEATVSVPLDGTEGSGYLETLREMTQAVGAPILVGALGMAVGDVEAPELGSGPLPPEPGSGKGGPLPSPASPPSPPGPLRSLTNSAFLIRLDGTLGARYDKVRLVPGMEWGGFSAGHPGEPIVVDGHTVGILICYESLFGGLARAQRVAGGEVLVNLTSDVWFGEGTGGLSSIFLHQHAAHMIMRAVESRAGVARAANGGFSFLLDPLGRPVTSTVPPEGGFAQAPIPVTEGVTVFARTGDLVGPGATVLWVLALGSLALRGRRGQGFTTRHPKREALDG